MTLAPDTQQIESERLLLRRVSREDMPFFTRIHAIPDVARYVGHGRPRSVEESETWARCSCPSRTSATHSTPRFVALGELRAGFAGGARTGDNEANLVPFLDSRRVDVVFADEDTDSRLDLTYSANSDGWSGDRDPPRELPDGHGQGMSRWHRLPHIAPLLTEAGFNVPVGSCY